MTFFARFASSASHSTCIFAISFVLASGLSVAAASPAGEGAAGESLPVPRFVSLKSDKVNVRAGPTKDHNVTWVYIRTGLPVEITAEYENWRRIRDWEGAEGWVYHSLLSGRRMAMISAASKTSEDAVPLHSGADEDSAIVARLQAGVLAAVKRCTGAWCRLTGTGFDGWIRQDRLWGVYPNEKID